MEVHERRDPHAPFAPPVAVVEADARAPDEVDAPARFSFAILGVVLAYLVVATLGWYELKRRGYASSDSAPLVYGGGVLVYFTALWRFRGIAPSQLSRETIVVTVSALVWLTLFWFYGRRGNYSDWFGADPPWGGLRGLIPFWFFVATSVLLRTALPLLTGKVLLGRGPRDYGWRVRGLLKHGWLYALLVVIVVPAVFYATTLPSFLQKYPWCKQGVEDGQMRLGVLAVYLPALFVFFASGESFWRGWLLQGTARQLGYAALPLMLVPYVVGHYGKPIQETLLACVAGLALGYLSLKHRSFWPGAFTHFGVAMTMDLVALWRKGVEFVL